MDNWVSVKDKLPHGVSGKWDGLKSDPVLCIDTKDNICVAICYTGFIDGSDFCDWYSHPLDYSIDNITHWMQLPEPPTK